MGFRGSSRGYLRTASALTFVTTLGTKWVVGWPATSGTDVVSGAVAATSGVVVAISDGAAATSGALAVVSGAAVATSGAAAVVSGAAFATSGVPVAISGGAVAISGADSVILGAGVGFVAWRCVEWGREVSVFLNSTKKRSSAGRFCVELAKNSTESSRTYHRKVDEKLHRRAPTVRAPQCDNITTDIDPRLEKVEGLPR
jgi:hypothetical protein